MQLTVRRSGSLIDLSLDGQQGLPPEVSQLLIPHLVYEYRQQLRGADAYDPVTGRREGILVEPRALYELDGHGRLVTGYGMLPRLTWVLAQHGHTLTVCDLSPPRRRPNCYELDWAAVYEAIEFRPRQEECLRQIAAYDCGLVNAAPGFGKTFMFAAICLLYPRAKIHIVAKPKDIVMGIVQHLTRYIPMVGQIGGGRRCFGDRVTVIMADSLHHSDGDCDILLGEEAHQLMAPTYSEALGRLYRYCRAYAFTATPTGRFDGGDAKLEMFFGPEIFRLSYDEAVSLGLTAPIYVRWLPVRLPYNPAAGKTSSTSRKRWGIWRNNDRNYMIAQDARSAYPADHQVLMLVETIEHAIYLWQFLPEYHLCYGNLDEEDFEGYKRSRLLPESFVPVDAAIRENMRQAFSQGTLKKVIATDVWATGVDFRPLQTLYRVDARDSSILATQAPGRVGRTFDGKSYGEVVDCADFWDAGFKRKARTKFRLYQAQGWLQHWPRGERQISG